MATVECTCPLGVRGIRRVHNDTCPNRKRGKGTQPRNYTGKSCRPRSYSQARLSVEHLRDVLLRMAAACSDAPALQLAVADCRMQCETVRRYLDGE